MLQSITGQLLAQRPRCDMSFPLIPVIGSHHARTMCRQDEVLMLLNDTVQSQAVYQVVQPVYACPAAKLCRMKHTTAAGIPIQNIKLSFVHSQQKAPSAQVSPQITHH
eukprot:GHRR01006611.1.p2 GENE.GHRR01006611.1~~GHRR01006611.1.p2  ORF type:complete len:108 (+),score=12.54 GHRR01006611.1:3497-3820(+)